MSDTQLIKEKLDVVDLIGEYVQMKPAGVNHKGLCPFHNEKSPSFMASRERQSWHCFGCGKGGDIFTFVQELEGMDFREALKYLANKAGVQLTTSFQNEVASSQKNRIKEINQETARFFHKFLLQMPASQPARDYLTNRGLTHETIDHWQIGFIPEQWDLLTQYLLKKGFGIDDLVASGLTIKKDSANAQSLKGFYDRFRGRIMFPIWDVHNNVVGFTGRILVETDKSGGKYVNTPQTPVYDKSRVVFGLNFAKHTIRHEDLIVMVEGQMDVIACHQAGMTNVVATSGTAMTEHQVKLLKRYSSNLSMAFDADEAGEKAAKRGIDIAIESGMNVRVIQIPDGAGKDPDEAVKKNEALWFDAVKHAEDVMKWYFSRAFHGRDMSSPKDKQHIATTLLREIRRIPYAIERDHWLQELSARLRVDATVLREDMARIQAEEKETRTVARSTDNAPVEPVPALSHLDSLIERFIMLVLAQKVGDKQIPFPLNSLSTGMYQDLYERIKTMYTTSGSIDIPQLREFYATQTQESQIDILLMMGEKDFATYGSDELYKELLAISARIQKEYIDEQRQRLNREIAAAERDGNRDKAHELMKELMKL